MTERGWVPPHEDLGRPSIGRDRSSSQSTEDTSVSYSNPSSQDLASSDEDEVGQSLVNTPITSASHFFEFPTFRSNRRSPSHSRSGSSFGQTQFNTPTPTPSSAPASPRSRSSSGQSSPSIHFDETFFNEADLSSYDQFLDNLHAKLQEILIKSQKSLDPSGSHVYKESCRRKLLSDIDDVFERICGPLLRDLRAKKLDEFPFPVTDEILTSIRTGNSRDYNTKAAKGIGITLMAMRLIKRSHHLRIREADLTLQGFQLSAQNEALQRRSESLETQLHSHDQIRDENETLLRRVEQLENFLQQQGWRVTPVTGRSPRPPIYESKKS